MSDGQGTVADGPAQIDTGIYVVSAACPRCGVLDEFLVKVGVTLTTPDDAVGSLRVKLKGKARDHDCQQPRIVEVVR